jgi:hypothetical protein
MGDIRFPFEESTIVYCDNQSAIQVDYNPIAHSEMKHVEPHSHDMR